MINQSKLKKFAISSRTKLIGLVSDKIDYYAAMESTKADSLGIGSQHSSLRRQLDKLAKQQLAEQVAYTWFNRFVALRFMDANDYTHPKIVTPQGGQGTIPEILQDAIGGIVQNGLNVSRQDVLSTLGDTTGGKDPQGLAFRKLLLASCNKLSSDMPEMFEQISDYTELLLPDDLLSPHSILSDVRDTVTDDDCKDVEIIGWLYQYYISERKDEVFANFKKNKKAEAKDIPAATQLFTPHWIVRYLVENSLGRLWLLNNPHSKIAAKMPYYIAPETAEDDYLKVKSPTELKVCDPACGSGHMLTYAFDLLYEIYNEAGYSPLEIPELILKNNLYGVEIDQRAGSLANFALVMKAKSYNPQADISKLQPNICVLQNIVFTDDEIKEYMAAAGSDLFTSQLRSNLNAFAEADNFGSLITTTIPSPGELATELDAKVSMSNLFMSNIHPKVMRFLEQAEFLSQKYHVVVANPPYMGVKNMNPRLAQFLKDDYEEYKSDLFSAFIARCFDLSFADGQLGFMSPFVWMFISSYEKLRKLFIEQKTITSLIQLEYSGFDGATVPICTFTLQNSYSPNYLGGYIRLSDFRGPENQSPRALEAINNQECGWFYRKFANVFKKIPGSPIAYWASSTVFELFERSSSVSEYFETSCGLFTCNNDLFIRYWWEVSENVSSIFGREGAKWVPHTKGANGTKWCKSNEYVVNYQDNGGLIKSYRVSRGQSASLPGQKYYFKSGVTFPMISSSNFTASLLDGASTFDISSNAAFSKGHEKLNILLLSLLCSKLSAKFLDILCPTINFLPSDIEKIPFDYNSLITFQDDLEKLIYEIVSLSQSDIDSFESSFNFRISPMLRDTQSLLSAYTEKRICDEETVKRIKDLEQENNRILISLYGLGDELTDEVLVEDITLLCNPNYRYRGKKVDIDIESLMLGETISEYISYAIGCVMGRYSIDKPGLILANQGDDTAVYEQLVPEARFMADADGIIPMLDDEWFPDDATEQVKRFVKVTFGTEKYDENIRFIEESIGKSLRQYLLKDFYPEHVKRYKKRPIYWLFTSPKGHFRALIYMHRYRPDTLSTMRNEYLQPFIAKLEDKKSHSENMIPHAQNDREKVALQKDVERLSAMLADLREYEKKLTDVASRKIAIDLDDGVKVNYAKFSEVIAKVAGL